METETLLEIGSNGLKDEQTKSGIKIKNEKKIKKKNKKILYDLFIELVKFQKEVIASDLKLLVILEGRDATGKDGTDSLAPLTLETEWVILQQLRWKYCSQPGW